MAAGEGSAIVSSNDPATGPWRAVQVGQGLSDREYPPPPPGLPPRFPGPQDLSTYRDIHGISCPSTRLCVAVSFDGYVFSSTDPTGPAETWHAADVDGDERHTHLMGVSCPSVSLCVAVSGERYTAGKVLTSTDPTGGSASWSVLQLDEELDLRGISCATPRLCVAVGENGRMIVSTDPTGGIGAWREIGTPAGPGDMRGISCVSTPFCVAGNFGGNVVASNNPTAGASAWSERDGGGSVLITGVSCLITGGCVAVDNNGDVLTSSDPLDPRSAWSFENVIPYREPAPSGLTDNAMFGVSCVSRSFCAVAAAGSRVYTSTDPFVEGAQRVGNTTTRQPLRPRTKLAHVDHVHARTRTGWTPMRFRFYAKTKVRGFLCRIDERPFKRCRSPKRFRRVAVGWHVFRVRAIGPTGLKGRIASDRFRVVPGDFVGNTPMRG